MILATPTRLRGFDKLLQSVAEPGPNTRWLSAQSEALARIRAEREEEAKECGHD